MKKKIELNSTFDNGVFANLIMNIYDNALTADECQFYLHCNTQKNWTKREMRIKVPVPKCYDLGCTVGKKTVFDNC